MIGLLLTFLFCVIGSAFCSAAEMAFVSANTIKFRELADRGNFSAQKILKLQESPQQLLTVILIGNNISNIAATSIAAYLFHRWWGTSNEWLVTAIMAPLLIVACETVPKE